MKKASRRQFIKKTALGTAGLAMGFSAKSYNSILGANDRVRVGIVGFSNRAKGSLIPSFLKKAKMMNFEIVGVSDIWNRRREEGQAYIKEKSGKAISAWRNNEEMYDQNEIDAVIISTADFQHVLQQIFNMLCIPCKPLPLKKMLMSKSHLQKRWKMRG